MSAPRLAVVYIGDQKCHQLSLYSLASIARSHAAPLDLHFLQSNYDAEIPEALITFVASCGHRLIAARADFELPEVGSRDAATTWAYITDTMFLKAAAIESLASSYDYILYVDSDILAFADLNLAELAGFEEVAAACIDLTVAGTIEWPASLNRSNSQTIEAGAVFNSGMVMVNAKRWRAEGVYERYLDCLREHQSGCPYHRNCEPNDQCAFNMALAGEWRQLMPGLNLQKVAMHTNAWAVAPVRHYSGSSKFWPMRMHRCDRREYALLCSISKETGLPHPGSFYDGGLSYWLNGIRRARDVSRAERTLAHAYMLFAFLT
jgi:lipopolysaccharide biosynthesis glycosyltransferase